MIGKALGLVAGVALLGVVALADDADATHFFSGSLSYSQGPAPGTFYIDSYLSFDSKYGVGDPTLCDAYLPGMRLPQSVGPEAAIYWWGKFSTGALVFPQPGGGNFIPFEVVVVAVDPDHCRFIGQAVQPGTMSPPIFTAPVPGSNQPFELKWTNCCRDDDPRHRNNGNRVSIQMVTTVNPVNTAPAIDFVNSYVPKGIFSEVGYGNAHCPQDTICQFRVKAGDPDGDRMAFRLATPGEAGPIILEGAPASPTNAFVHPGPPFTGGYGIDVDTGIVTWDTRGTTVGEWYSTQIIVEDGYSQGVIDFSIEIGYPIYCPGGGQATLDWDTGQVICPPPPCPPGQMQVILGDPYSGCMWPPVDPFVVPKEQEPVPGQPWYMPLPPAPAYKPPAVSEVHYGAARAGDRVDGDIAGLDQDDDGVPDRDDLCPFDGRSAYEDADSDGIGDACDADADGDGVDDAYDPCPDEDCPEPVAPLAKLLGSQDVGVFAAGVQEEREEAGPVNVAFVAPESKAGAQSFVLGMVGAAMAVLLLGMAMRRRG